jgi:hypothetical protein
MKSYKNEYKMITEICDKGIFLMMLNNCAAREWCV